MKAAVYNQFWASMGGGERHSAKIAEILSQSGVEVDLVGHIPVPLETLSSRLALDLSKTTMRTVPDLGEDAMSELSGEYDLFINGTYMSRVKSRAARSVYLCYFPTPVDHDLSPVLRKAIKVFGPYASKASQCSGFHYGPGWFPPEGGRRRQWIWSNGNGEISFNPGGEYVLHADFGRPGIAEPSEVVIEMADGEVLGRFSVDGSFARHVLTVPASLRTRTVRFRSATFSPGGTDTRVLGFAISRIGAGTGRSSPAEWLTGRFPWLARDPSDLAYLDTYDLVLANSAYTQGWISRLWNRPSEVLFPPIKVDKIVPAAAREKTVLSVGRFFAPGYGHSKRQLEMVQMFGRLARSGQLDGWKLVVVGGCEDYQRPYLELVQQAAVGLPVEVHANAARSLVDTLMATSSIFWSATGLHENTERKPWTNEHFGMTTAEAMAGGCVPVVIDRAGQREIVRQAIDGFRWVDERELRIRTIQVAMDDELRARMAASSIERVQQFSEAAFADRWNHLFGQYDLSCSANRRD